jgi:hypothetical protein
MTTSAAEWLGYGSSAWSREPETPRGCPKMPGTASGLTRKRWRRLRRRAVESERSVHPRDRSTAARFERRTRCPHGRLTTGVPGRPRGLEQPQPAPQSKLARDSEQRLRLVFDAFLQWLDAALEPLRDDGSASPDPRVIQLVQHVEICIWEIDQCIWADPLPEPGAVLRRLIAAAEGVDNARAALANLNPPVPDDDPAADLVSGRDDQGTVCRLREPPKSASASGACSDTGSRLR